MLTEVLSEYATYDLKLLDSQLSSARIYRFTIGEDLDEQVVANALQADEANFAWAEVNFVTEIPSGPVANPYRSWKWGSSDPTGYVNQDAFAEINFPGVEGIYSGTGVTVAVLDTGVDATHPVFAGRLVLGRGLVHFDDTPQDGPEPGQPGGAAQGHGTHVSGVITRIAPGSKIMPLRILNVDGRGNTFILAYAIEWAVINGADVINMSLGTDCSSKVLEEAVASAQAQGVVMVAAAGNGNVKTPQCPAGDPGVLAVTAVDDEMKKADFANYGDLGRSGGAWSRYYLDRARFRFDTLWYMERHLHGDPVCGGRCRPGAATPARFSAGGNCRCPGQLGDQPGSDESGLHWQVGALAEPTCSPAESSRPVSQKVVFTCRNRVRTSG